jgi:hypothetical protein
MDHPWLDIPISDYEAHMGLPSVRQAQLLAETLRRVVATYRPRSLAILGAAGGNGLELVDPAIVRRVVAVDFNPEYLAVCTDRHAASFARFEPILHDLSQGPPALEPVECIYAGLVLEYVATDHFFAYLASLMAGGGIFVALLQLPSPDLPEVSVSPFRSLEMLRPVFSPVNPELMHDALVMRSFSPVEEERIVLASGKSFHYAAYRRPDRPADRGAWRGAAQLLG